jgi:hypothetical protein
MSTLSSNLFLYLSKPVKDEYGQQIGRITSCSVSPNGRSNYVFLEHGDGEFVRYKGEQFRIENDEIILVSTLKLRVKTLCEEIPLIWRRDQALGELLDKKKIPSEMFNELHKNFEDVLTQLKVEAQSDLENMDKQIAKCDQQVKVLHLGLTHLEIEREIGRIDDNVYPSAVESIQERLRRVNSEKKDHESMRNQLSNMLIGDTPNPEKESQQDTESEFQTSSILPEPPIVVYMKSGGKTGS